MLPDSTCSVQLRALASPTSSATPQAPRRIALNSQSSARKILMSAYLAKNHVRTKSGTRPYGNLALKYFTAVPQVQIELALQRIAELRNLSTDGVDPCVPNSPLPQVSVYHSEVYESLTTRTTGKHEHRLYGDSPRGLRGPLTPSRCSISHHTVDRPAKLLYAC